MNNPKSKIARYVRRALRLQVKHKKLVSLSSAILFFVLLLSGSMLWVTYNETKKQARVDSSNTSLILNQNIQSIFNKIDLSLSSMAKTLEVDKNNRRKYNISPISMMDLHAQMLPEVFAFRATDATGTVILSTDKKAAPNLSLADRPYFQHHLKNTNSELIISEPLVSKFTGKLVLTLSRRIIASDNSFKGIIYAVVELDYLNKLMSDLKLGKNGNISIVSTEDEVLIYRYPDIPGTLGKKLLLHPETKKLISAGLESGEWEQSSTLDQKKKTYAVRVNKKFKYLVATGLAEDDYFASWRISLGLTVAVNLIFLVIFISALGSYIASIEDVEFHKIEMLEASRRYALARIASGVAHEINNPLAIIKGKSELIKHHLGEVNVPIETIMRKLSEIDSTVERVAKIVRSMQTLEELKKDFIVESKMDHIVSSVRSLVKDKFSSTGVELIINEVPDIHLAISTDEAIQVFVQLITNSWDAVKNQQQSKWVKLSFEEKRNSLKIRFTDSGLGVDVDIAKSMKDAFFTTKEPGQGMGLGLSVVDSLVKSNSGKFYFNQDSKFTEFVVEINYAKSGL